jgi:hypothetical protein
MNKDKDKPRIMVINSKLFMLGGESRYWEAFDGQRIGYGYTPKDVWLNWWYAKQLNVPSVPTTAGF